MIFKPVYSKAQMRQIIATSAQIAAKQALVSAGVDKAQIKRAEAYRRFGKYTVDNWIKSGAIEIIKNGGASMLDLMELEVLSKVNSMYQTHLKEPERT